MWNRHPVVRQEKLEDTAKSERAFARLRRAFESGETYEGTPYQVKRLTGKEPLEESES